MNDQIISLLERFVKAHETLAINVGRIADELGLGPMERQNMTGLETIKEAISDLAEAVREHGRTDDDSDE